MLRAPDKRLVAILLRLAGCRENIPSDFRSAEIDASQDELASMANVARVTAGLILRKFAKDGAIELAYRRIVVVDPDRLRQILVS